MKASARLNKEIQDLSTNPIDNVEVNLQDDNVVKWDVKIGGPSESPYEGGTFLVELDFSDNYPFKAPKILFKTKIYHPNVETATGKICTQAIEKSWVPTQNARYVIECIVSLMSSPRGEDPLEQAIADQFINKYDDFVRDARKWTTDYA